MASTDSSAIGSPKTSACIAVIARTSASAVILPQLDPAGQLDVDRQQLRLADHDRLRLLRLEPVPEECVVEPRRVVVPSGLPFHALDRRVVAIVGDRLFDQSLDGCRVGSAEVPIGHEAMATGEWTNRSGPSCVTSTAPGVSTSVRSWTS